ncbi:MAG: phosphate ABC transporter permease PstA [Alphaproteobacteria bacterium GM7ARS4]|nr:phosphate ABC transporter permease PstA [Alphaproteobacteria bacterium GM7ARS4]
MPLLHKRPSTHGLERRLSKERHFHFLGRLATAISLFFLVVLFAFILGNGISGFFRYDIALSFPMTEEQGQSYRKALYSALYEKLGVTDTADRLMGRQLLSRAAPDVLQEARRTQEQKAQDAPLSLWIPASMLVENIMKGRYDSSLPEEQRLVKDKHIAWVRTLDEGGFLRWHINRDFFTNGATSSPETAGIGIALLGSLIMMVIVVLVSVPVGVCAAIYLEEFAPKHNRFIYLLELNINNLAAVPSIVFGILGLAIFINVFGIPRSSPLTGGLVLSLMTLPTVIISARSVLKAVPLSLKWSAYGLGASKHQVIFHHVLPVATPGIATGAIIGLAQALGETAPLLMIGMFAFVADYPQSLLEPASALPVQTFIWAGSPEPGFAQRTAASIIVLLFFLITMNATAVYLRQKFEIKW